MLSEQKTKKKGIQKMAVNRRAFLVRLGLFSFAGMVCKSEAARELNKVRGRTFVAACPPSDQGRL